MIPAFIGTQRHAFLTLAVAMVLGLPQPVSAQDEAKAAKTRQLIEVLEMVERADNLAITLMTELQYMATAANPGKDDIVAGLMREKLLPAMRRHLPAYVELVAGLYAEHFTVAELEETIEFFQSPTGRKWIVTQPLVLKQSQKVAVAWAQNVVAEAMRDVEAEFQKRGLKLPPI